MGVKIALAGNPNSGKTTLFNAYTLQIPHQQNFSYLWGRNDPFTSRKVLRSCARFCVAPHSTF